MARDFRTPKRRKEWQSISSSELALTANGTSVGGGLTQLTGGTTIVRVRGEILIRLTPGGTFAAGDDALITIGLGVFNADAFTLGATAMPEPSDDVEFPWMWWHQTRLGAFSNSAESTSSIVVADRVKVDCKAMRKVPLITIMGWVVQYEDVSGAPPVSVGINRMRVLAALP